ncbi:hypothetical protein [Pantoea stewartii]|uniref:Phage protein n=1 Tax=Pantoea stewartii subsp. stewartii DC283 TaxID=660596 RepID=A0ABM6K938_PANSE|nr:hypothetical protein [Pantoea stewartii]ARF50816.1 hypothetical protein DSJ_16720 [Pantoea stewartii subsp. stewartii DC283]
MDNQQTINHLTAEIKTIKEALAQQNLNFVNLLARSEFTAGIISAMIADGVIQRDGVINYLKSVELNIPDYQDSVEGARETLIKILGSVKTR